MPLLDFKMPPLEPKSVKYPGAFSRSKFGTYSYCTYDQHFVSKQCEKTPYSALYGDMVSPLSAVSLYSAINLGPTYLPTEI